MLLTGSPLPFPFAVSNDLQRARTHTTAWMAAHRLFDVHDATADKTACDLAEMAAYIFPEATGPDLDLAYDLIGWLYFFDDLLGGPLGRRPDDAAALADQFTAVIRGTPHLDPAKPGVSALADLWARQTSGMSASWRARAAYNWEVYLCSHPQESINKHRGGVADRNSYLEVRYGASGSEVVLDFTERLAHSEVPPVALHCLPLRLMRRIAVDVPNFCNDIHSADRERALGDPHNLVLVVQKEEGCPRDEAVETVHRMIWSRVEQFQRLETEARTACELMALTREQQAAVDRYVRGMESLMRGYDEWGRTSARYTDVSFTPPWQSAGTA